MYKFFILIIMIVSSIINAQLIDEDSISNFQDDVGNNSVVNTNNGTINTSSNSLGCKEQDSLPLKYFYYLFKEKGSELRIEHDSDNKTLNIAGNRIVANCRKMFEFKLQNFDNDENSYLKISFKKNNCSNNLCKYFVVKNNVEEEKEFEPSLKGFLACMEYAEVYKKESNGKYKLHDNYKNAAMFREVDETIKNVPDQTSNLYFLSTGDEASAVGPVYGKIKDVRKDTCDYVEDITKNGMKLYSTSDSDYNEKLLKFQMLCKEEDYKKIVGNLGELSSFRDELLKVAKEQIKEEIKKTIIEINTLEDSKDISKLNLEVFKDFQDYVLYPLEKNIEQTYKAWFKEKDADKKKKLETELIGLKKELSKYNEKPFLTEDIFKKLVKSGRFPEAKEVYLSLKGIEEFEKVGKLNGRYYSSDLAWENIKAAKKNYNEKEEDIILKYERQNCTRVGDSNFYIKKYKTTNMKLTVMHKKYQSYFMQIEKNKMKSCNKYWIDQRACIAQFNECLEKSKSEYLEKRNKLMSELKEYETEAVTAKNDEKRCENQTSQNEDDDDGDVDLEPTQFDFEWSNSGNNSQQNNWNYSNNINTGWNNNNSFNTGWNNNGWNNNSFNTGWNNNSFNTGWNNNSFNTGWNNNSFNTGWNNNSFNTGWNNNSFNTGWNNNSFNNNGWGGNTNSWGQTNNFNPWSGMNSFGSGQFNIGNPMNGGSPNNIFTFN